MNCSCLVRWLYRHLVQGFAGWRFRGHSSAECHQRLSGQLVGGDYKYTVGCWITDINYPQNSSRIRTPDRYTRFLGARPILVPIRQNLLNFYLVDIVIVKVRKAGSRIEVEPDGHGARIGIESRLRKLKLGSTVESDGITAWA